MAEHCHCKLIAEINRGLHGPWFVPSYACLVHGPKAYVSTAHGRRSDVQWVTIDVALEQLAGTPDPRATARSAPSGRRVQSTPGHTGQRVRRGADHRYHGQYDGWQNVDGWHRITPDIEHMAQQVFHHTARWRERAAEPDRPTPRPATPPPSSPPPAPTVPGRRVVTPQPGAPAERPPIFRQIVEVTPDAIFKLKGSDPTASFTHPEPR